MLNQQQSTVWVVIPAAGLGQRMGSSVPKQYLKIHDKSLLEHTLDCFANHHQVAGIVVVLSANDEYWHTLELTRYAQTIHTTIGGANRSYSVAKGLRFLLDHKNLADDSWVMVHDAARPCLASCDIDALLAIRDDDCGNVGGILASPVRDTMKRTFKNNKNDTFESVSNTESRDKLWHALTPQLFRLGDLNHALQYCFKHKVEVTDECSAMEAMGDHPIIVEGRHDNIKITYPSDIEFAAYLINKKS